MKWIVWLAVACLALSAVSAQYDVGKVYAFRHTTEICGNNHYIGDDFCGESLACDVAIFTASQALAFTSLYTGNSPGA